MTVSTVLAREAAAAADDDYVNRRAARYAALRTVWRVSEETRLATCRRVPNGNGIEVRVKGVPGSPGARAALTGVQTCGSVWACPVCSEIINSKRQQDVEKAVTNWLDPAYEFPAAVEGDASTNAARAVTFATLTLQHHRKDDLTELWDAIADGWRKLTASVAWRGGKTVDGMKSLFGIEGVIRLVEVKHGKHGWHPHLHLLFFHDGELRDDEMEQLRSLLFGKWSQVLGRAGYKALEFDQTGQAVGVDLRRVKDADYIAEYMAKNGYRPKHTTAAKGAAYEVTGSHSKKAGKGGSRTPFEILAGVVAHEALTTVLPDGETWVDRQTGVLLTSAEVEASVTDLLLWREWEKKSKGRRQLTWSKGLRTLVGLDEVDDTDDAVVDKNSLDGEPADLGDEDPIMDIMSVRGTGAAERPARKPQRRHTPRPLPGGHEACEIRRLPARRHPAHTLRNLKRELDRS